MSIRCLVFIALTGCVGTFDETQGKVNLFPESIPVSAYELCVQRCMATYADNTTLVSRNSHFGDCSTVCR